MVRFAAVVVGIALVGCKGSPARPDAALDGTPTLWWEPRPGEFDDWDIQLVAPLDVDAPRDAYFLDLWDVTPARMIDYGDGSPVSVPAGPLAGRIEMLQDAGAKVVCVISTGALRLDDPDAMKFPGYAATPPNRPDPVAAGSVIGWDTLKNDPNERFLDIRAASRGMWTPLMWKRFDLAESIGCDAIAAANNTMIVNGDFTTSGFDLTDLVADQRSWFLEIANQAHTRMLSVGSFNGHELEGQPDASSEVYDWTVVERCAEYDECGFVKPYLDKNKAVFAVDYQPLSASSVCGRYEANQIRDGLLKDDPPTGGFREACP